MSGSRCVAIVIRRLGLSGEWFEAPGGGDWKLKTALCSAPALCTISASRWAHLSKPHPSPPPKTLPTPSRPQLPVRSAHASWHNKLWYADCPRDSPSFNCALKGALASDNVALMRNWHFVTRSPPPLRLPDKMLRCFLRRTTVLPSNAPILLCDPLDEYRFHCAPPQHHHHPPLTTPSFQRSNYKRFKTIPALIDKG